jgi:hypothetical protein
VTVGDGPAAESLRGLAAAFGAALSLSLSVAFLLFAESTGAAERGFANEVSPSEHASLA